MPRRVDKPWGYEIRQPGERRHVAPGKTHRYEATTDRVTLIEVSTPELDDVVRLEDDFGRQGTSAP